jgi:hypothetical protein
LGRLVRFPIATRRSEAEWHDPAENVLRSTRKNTDVLLLIAIDAKRSRETDEDFDGGGGSAA